jgi:hypothetical protein
MSWLRLMEEKIKEAEAPEPEGAEAREAEGAEAPGGQTPANKERKKNRVRKLIVEMWPAYLIEILVIILGISISLALEQWRDRSREKELESIYQKNLLDDINADLRSLHYALTSTEELLSKGNELLAFVGNPTGHPIPPARADSDLRIILGRPNFNSNDATFSDLKNSGNLHLLSDIRLKQLLFAYYSQVQIIKETQDAEKQATIVISGPYFLKTFQFNSVNNAPSAIDERKLRQLSQDIEFGNIVFFRVDNRSELLGDFQQADTLAIRIKDALGKRE